MNIVFPEKKNQRYWDIHFAYVLNIFKHLNYNITYADRGDAFIVTINGKDFLFDYADTADVATSSLPIFKFHTENDKTLPFPPVSFYDWNEYEHRIKNNFYYSHNELISNRQRAYGNAKVRRSVISSLLSSKYNESVLTDVVSQTEFFNEVSKVKAYVHVPGHHNNMVDRATVQMFALGCPVITTHIPDLLPDGNDWDNTYIECKDDYSDLINLIDTTPATKLVQVKQLAQFTFQTYCTPKAIDSYLKRIICGI